jgi:Protein of unknown function (DUF1579)
MIDHGTNPFGAPLPSLELKRLEPLVGRWQTTARTEAGVLGPSVPVTSLEEFYWLEGGYFLVQTYETAFGDEPAQKGINYWFYDAAERKFRIIFSTTMGRLPKRGTATRARSSTARSGSRDLRASSTTWTPLARYGRTTTVRF